MLIREKTAHLMTCPISMGNSHNKPSPCKGVECMAWRSDGYREGDDQFGYCGMASTPLEVVRSAILDVQRELMRRPWPEETPDPKVADPAAPRPKAADPAV